MASASRITSTNSPASCATRTSARDAVAVAKRRCGRARVAERQGRPNTSRRSARTSPRSVDRRSVGRLPLRRRLVLRPAGTDAHDTTTAATRISNPGCYATAMQLAIAPLKDGLAAPPACFGVSGYSGAGTTPSDRNDPDKLRDNLMPYALTDHVHEREVTRASRRAGRVHAARRAAFSRHHDDGESLAAAIRRRATSIEARYREFYAGEPLGAHRRRGAVGQPHRRASTTPRSAASRSRPAASASSSSRRSTICSRARRRRRCRTESCARLRRVRRDSARRSIDRPVETASERDATLPLSPARF